MPNPAQQALIVAARHALAIIFPGLAAYAGRPTTDAAIRRHIAGQPWGGLYTRVDGLNIGVHQFGPTLFLGRAPAPWQRDADLTLAGPDLLTEIRATFEIPADAPALHASHTPTPSLRSSAETDPSAPDHLPSAITSGEATHEREAFASVAPSTAIEPPSVADNDSASASNGLAATDEATPTVRRLFGVYRHFLIPADAVPPGLAGVIAGSDELEATLRRATRYTGAGSHGYTPTVRPVLDAYVLDIPGNLKAAPFGLRELDYFEMKEMNLAHYAAILAAARAQDSTLAPDDIAVANLPNTTTIPHPADRAPSSAKSHHPASRSTASPHTAAAKPAIPPPPARHPAQLNLF